MIAEARYSRGMAHHHTERPAGMRWSTAADADGLADLHRAAWRYAYAGIIPGLTLERMIARRGRSWWAPIHERGFHALVAESRDGLSGYATLGRAREGPARTGEIYELYVRPEYHGCGVGRGLFARGRRELARRELDRLVIWALAENTVACRFYAAMGGTEHAAVVDRFCGVPLAKIGFSWP
jgi:GNAT superfamily N-acetyltransferase